VENNHWNSEPVTESKLVYAAWARLASGAWQVPRCIRSLSPAVGKPLDAAAHVWINKFLDYAFAQKLNKSKIRGEMSMPPRFGTVPGPGAAAVPSRGHEVPNRAHDVIIPIDHVEGDEPGEDHRGDDDIGIKL